MKGVLVLLLRVVGVVVALTSLWVGCYALSEAKGDETALAWWAFPAYMTMAGFVAGGVFLTVFAKDVVR